MRILTAYERVAIWHEAAGPNKGRFEFVRGMFGTDTGDDDPSGLGMTNRELEGLFAENKARGYEPWGDPRYAPGLRWRRIRQPPPKMVEVAPDSAQQVAKLVADFSAQHPKVRMDEFPLTSDPRMVKDLLSGLHDMMIKYPEWPRAITTTYASGRKMTHPRWYASTEWPTGNLGASISWLNDYEGAQKAHRQNVADHFNAPNDRPTGYYTGVHEFGHLLAFRGMEAVYGLNAALRNHFLELHPELTRQKRGTADAAYSDWLHEQVPSYALKTDAPSGWLGKNPNRARIVPHEALAEAFADAELNGDKASDASKFLHQRLLDAAQQGWARQQKRQQDKAQVGP